MLPFHNPVLLSIKAVLPRTLSSHPPQESLTACLQQQFSHFPRVLHDNWGHMILMPHAVLPLSTPLTLHFATVLRSKTVSRNEIFYNAAKALDPVHPCEAAYRPPVFLQKKIFSLRFIQFHKRQGSKIIFVLYKGSCIDLF